MPDAVLDRLEIVERDLVALRARVNEIPNDFKASILEHEKREFESRKAAYDALADTIVAKIIEGLLGPDLSSGPDAIKNTRALQEFLRIIVKTSPMWFRLKMGLLVILGGALLLSVSDLLISALKSALGVG